MSVSQYQAAALAFVCEHPGCTTSEVALSTGLTAEVARRSLEALYTKRLLGRQHSLVGSSRPSLWFPEERALRQSREVKT